MPALTSPEVASLAQAGTVRVSTLMGGGSGFAVSSSLVITAEHVVDGLFLPSIETPRGESCELQNMATFPHLDIALIWVTGCELEPLEISKEGIRVGQEVWAAGHPSGLGWTVTRGIVSHTDRTMWGHEVFQSDVVVNPGMSGGPVLDQHGHVVGMSVGLLSKDSLYAGVSYITPASVIADVVTQFWADEVSLTSDL
jgi:S1-C subfamily serine protease